jgi:hypothetical protein
MKTPVILSKDYTVYLEYFDTMSFIHCDCLCWNKAVKKALLIDFDKLVQIHRSPIYALHEINDKKHLKFLELFGFVFSNLPIGLDNTVHHLYKRGS